MSSFNGYPSALGWLNPADTCRLKQLGLVEQFAKYDYSEWYRIPYYMLHAESYPITPNTSGSTFEKWAELPNCVKTLILEMCDETTLFRLCMSPYCPSAEFLTLVLIVIGSIDTDPASFASTIRSRSVKTWAEIPKTRDIVDTLSFLGFTRQKAEDLYDLFRYLLVDSSDFMTIVWSWLINQDVLYDKDKETWDQNMRDCGIEAELRDAIMRPEFKIARSTRSRVYHWIYDSMLLRYQVLNDIQHCSTLREGTIPGRKGYRPPRDKDYCEHCGETVVPFLGNLTIDTEEPIKAHPKRPDRERRRNSWGPQ